MDLKEKIENNRLKKAKEELWMNIGGLFLCWSVFLPLCFHLVVQVSRSLDPSLEYRDQILLLVSNTWWILIPMIAAYYQLKNGHRKLGL